MAGYVFQIVYNDEGWPREDDIAELFSVSKDTVPFITYEFVEAFVEGACDVWEEVEDEL